MTSTPTRHADRYGGPLVPARTAKVLIIAGAVVALTVLVLVGLRFADQPVKGELLTYDHVSDAEVEVTFMVTMAPGEAASCTVQAMNEGRAQVGFVEVEIPPQDERQSVHAARIATQGEAVSAEVLGCERA